MIWMPADWVGKTAPLRSVLRRSGLTRYLSSVRPMFGTTDYEQRVDQALAALVQPGDCVWDVGANVGLYTERFAEAVGATGTVVAFEPIASTYQALQRRVQGFKCVQTRQEALGAKQGTVTLALDEDPTSPMNSLSRTSITGNERTQLVHIVSGDELVAAGAAPAPTVMKIDTEGFEEDVLWGMRQLLRAPQLRGILIEVHFALLEGRGHRRAPERLCSMLDDASFAVRWVDASHLLATRTRRGVASTK